MSGELGLVAYLGTAPNVAGLIGARLYPLVLPQEPVLPAMTYAIPSEARNRTQSSIGPANPRFRFSLYGATYDEVLALEVALRRDLDGRELPAGKFLFDSAQDDRDPDTGLVRRLVDYHCWTEVTP